MCNGALPALVNSEVIRCVYLSVFICFSLIGCFQDTLPQTVTLNTFPSVSPFVCFLVAFYFAELEHNSECYSASSLLKIGLNLYII